MTKKKSSKIDPRRSKENIIKDKKRAINMAYHMRSQLKEYFTMQDWIEVFGRDLNNPEDHFLHAITFLCYHKVAETGNIHSTCPVYKITLSNDQLISCLENEKSDYEKLIGNAEKELEEIKNKIKELQDEK